MVDLSEVWPEWTVEKVLGSGSYGTVYKAVRYDYVKSEAAIKVISVPKRLCSRNRAAAETARPSEHRQCGGL